MSKNKSKSEKEDKKKKGKKEVADVIADAVGNLARKSTKKIIKSMEKRAENLIATLTPAILKATDGEKKAKKEKIPSGKEALSDQDKSTNKKPSIKSSKEKSSAEL